MIVYPRFWKRFFSFLRTDRDAPTTRRADVPGSVEGGPTAAARRETGRPSGHPGRMEDVAEAASRKDRKAGR